MASSEAKSLGDSLQEIGKIFSAKEQLSELYSDIRQAMENLTAVDKRIGSIDTSIPSLREFKVALQNCIVNAESLGMQIALSNWEHEAILKNIRETSNNRTLGGEQVSSMTASLQKLKGLYEEFGKNLNSFIGFMKELERVAGRVKDEAFLEEERVGKDAASTRSEAQDKSVRQWVFRICTFGLITLSSSFQDSVRSNNETYQTADRLDLLFEKYEKARESLDIAFKTIENIASKMDGRPIRLTEELLQIVRSVLQRYETIAEAQKLAAEEQKKTAEAQKLAAERENTIHEQEDEMLRQNEALSEEMNARKKAEEEKEAMAIKFAEMEMKLNEQMKLDKAIEALAEEKEARKKAEQEKEAMAIKFAEMEMKLKQMKLDKASEALSEEKEARKKAEQEKEEMAKENAKLEEKLRKIEQALEQPSPKQ